MDLGWHHLYEYDAWANDVTLSSIRDQGDAGEDARRLYAHLLAAELMWLARLRDEPPATSVWPSMTLEEMTRHTHELPPKWNSFIETSSQALDNACVYQNTRGERFQTPVNEILMHVLMHSGYHRGQIAVSLRAVGLVPGVTDFIAYSRR